MARGDYYGCAACGGKAFYDADIDWEHTYVGDVKALCTDCITTHKLQVVPRPVPIAAPNEMTCYACKGSFHTPLMELDECTLCKQRDTCMRTGGE